MGVFQKFSNKQKGFRYEVGVDGGVIGSHPIGVFLPSLFIIQSIYILPFTDLVSAGAAVVDIGLTGAIPNTDQILSNTIQGVAGDYTDYNLLTFGFGFTPATGATQYPNFTTPAYQDGGAGPGNSNGMQIIVTVSGADLTAGLFIGIINYYEL